MAERVGALVVGGGAIGLSIARSLSRELRGSCMLIERHGVLGGETSSRSSEVLHAGLYYAPSALKTRLCIEGRRRLLALMDAHGVQYSLCGKLVVASSAAECVSLRALHANGLRNGLRELRHLSSREEIARFEPDVRCAEAIFSPNSGIFDSHGVLCALERECESAQCEVVRDCAFLRAEPLPTGGFRVETSRGDILCDRLVNAAGLCAPQVAFRIANIRGASIPRPYYAKGNYFKLSAVPPTVRKLRHLVYPLPSGGGLGVHATLDLSGMVRFGPDTEWIKRPSASLADRTEDTDIYEHDISVMPTLDYSVNDAQREVFFAAIDKYWPDVRQCELQPDYCGIRPKLCGPSPPSTSSSEHKMISSADFCVHTEREHGLQGLICLYGIESPGWTSCLAVGEHVKNLMKE